MRPWHISVTSVTRSPPCRVSPRGRGVVAAVHVVGRLGIDQRRRLDAPAGSGLQVDQRGATTDYFKTMRIPLVQGQFFTDLDMPQNAEPVVVIDQKFAQRFWPNGDALGKHLWNDPERKMKIVGVVGVVKQYGLDVDGRIVVYRPSPNPGYHVAQDVLDPGAVSPPWSARSRRPIPP